MAEKRRGLGRGLGALIPPSAQQSVTGRPVDVLIPNGSDDDLKVVEQTVSRETSRENAAVSTEPDLIDIPGVTFGELPVSAISPNARQPRQVFDEDEMAELVHSIREIGVLQPVVVRPSGEGAYELIMGERRWRATQEAGMDTIPAIIRATDDGDMLRDALLENLHRAQLNPLEEAAAYEQLLADFACTHDELAKRIGRSRPQISNTIRLLRLPPLVQRRVSAGVLSAGHARALLGLDDASEMERLAQRIVAEGISVRSTEELVALHGSDTAKQKPTRSSTTLTDADREHLDSHAGRLSSVFDTRVGISIGRKKGKVTIEFSGMEDLDRIMTIISDVEDEDNDM